MMKRPRYSFGHNAHEAVKKGTHSMGYKGMGHAPGAMAREAVTYNTHSRWKGTGGSAPAHYAKAGKKKGY